MQEEDIYREWKTRRRRVPVPEHFTAGVMQRIETIAPTSDHEFPVGIFDVSDRLLRWSTAGGLILLGLFRILVIIANLLRPQLLLQ